MTKYEVANRDCTRILNYDTNVFNLKMIASLSVASRLSREGGRESVRSLLSGISQLTDSGRLRLELKI